VKSRIAIAAVVLVAVATLVCSGRKDSEPFIPEDYPAWASTVEGPLTYSIPGHENCDRVIYINRKGEAVTVDMREGRVSYDYPAGTKIVKEIYSNHREPDGNPDSVVLMLKDPANPMSRGGWVWVVKDPSTGRENVIDYEFCVDCHANANEPHPYGDKNRDSEFRDYVFMPYRK
jgi:hypothetical protein